MSDELKDGDKVIEIPQRQVVDAANQFREVSDLLWNQLPQHGNILPLLMLSGFTVELYLKSLNSKTVYRTPAELGDLEVFQSSAEPMKTGHSLVKLFEALPPDLKEGLAEAFRRQAIPTRESSITESLQANDLVFETARYLFEGKSPLPDSISSLMRLLRVVGDFVNGLVPPRPPKFPPATTTPDPR